MIGPFDDLDIDLGHDLRDDDQPDQLGLYWSTYVSFPVVRAVRVLDSFEESAALRFRHEGEGVRAKTVMIA